MVKIKATIYVSPLGSGNGSGPSAANAKAFQRTKWRDQGRGGRGTVMLLADQGNYVLRG